MMRISLWSGAAALVFLSSCGSDQTQPPDAGPATSSTRQQDAKQSPSRRRPPKPVRLDMMVIKALFGNDPAAPEVDNPITPEKVALGRMLYHEKHLSKNGDISCASCHDLANYGQDGLEVSPGTAGQKGERNSPTTWNSFRQFAQFWDYRASTVEEQSIMPVLNPIEHGLASEDEVVAKIKEKPELVAAFGKAFPGSDPVTAENFKLAIGAFERTLVTRSRFDEFLDGDSSALTNKEKLGLKTFLDVGCQTCHMSRLVGGSMQQKLGVYAPYPTEDTGRFKVTGKEPDKFWFKVPSLLNVAKTAPYNHDGKVKTLPQAVRQMAKIQLQKSLTEEQVDALVAFLGALTGPLPEDVIGQK